MKTYTKLGLAALAAGLAASGAFVATGVADDFPGWGGHGGWHGPMRGHGMFMMFEQLDQNGDGSVSKAELDQFRTEKLKEYDTNGDGSLTIEEFQPLFMEVTRPIMVRGFQFFDTDGDGKVTAEELAKPSDRMFERMDRDGDGVLKPVYGDMGPRGPRGPGMHGRFGPGPGRGPGPGPGPGLSDDDDGDGD